MTHVFLRRCLQELLLSLGCGHTFHDVCMGQYATTLGKHYKHCPCPICKHITDAEEAVDPRSGDPFRELVDDIFADDPIDVDSGDGMSMSQPSDADREEHSDGDGDTDTEDVEHATHDDDNREEVAPSPTTPVGDPVPKMQATAKGNAKSKANAKAKSSSDVAEVSSATAQSKASGKAKSKAKGKAKSSSVADGVGGPEFLPPPPKAKAKAKSSSVADGVGGAELSPPPPKTKAKAKSKATATAAAKAGGSDLAPPPAKASAQAEETPDTGGAGSSTDIVQCGDSSPIDNVFEGRVLCDSCKHFVHYTSCRVQSKQAQSWRCNACGTKTTQMRRALGNWPTDAFLGLTEEHALPETHLHTCTPNLPKSYLGPRFASYLLGRQAVHNGKSRSQSLCVTRTRARCITLHSEGVACGIRRSAFLNISRDFLSVGQTASPAILHF